MTSLPRIRINFGDPDSRSAWTPLESRVGARSSYFICRSEDDSLDVSAGGDDPSDYEKPMLLAVFHVEDPASVFIEAMESPNEAPYIIQNPSDSANRCRIPLSRPPSEHVLVLLNDRSLISIDGEKIQFNFGDSPSDSGVLAPRAAADEEGDIFMGVYEERHVQVVQSMQDSMVTADQEDRNGLDQDVLRESTPAIPETILEEEMVVVETPVKPRHFVPVSVDDPHKGQDSFTSIYAEHPLTGSQSADEGFVASVSRSGLIFAGHNGGRPGDPTRSQISIMDDADLSTSDEEHEAPQLLIPNLKGKRPESIPSEPDNIVATPGKEIPKGRGLAMGVGDSNLTSLGEPEDEKENRAYTSDMPGPTPTSHRGPSAEEGAGSTAGPGDEPGPRVHRAKSSEPLLEAFLLEERLKSATPAHTYSRRRTSTKSPVDKKKSGKSPATPKTADLGGDMVSDVPDDVIDQPQKKRKATEHPESASEGETTKKGSLRKSANKRRKPEAGEDLKKGRGAKADIVTPAKKRGRGGWKIVQSQSDNSADEEDYSTAKPAPRKKAAQAHQDLRESEGEPFVGGQEAQPASTAKSAERPLDENPSIGVASEEPPATTALQEVGASPLPSSQERIVLKAGVEAVQPKQKRTKQPAKGKGAKRKSLRAATPAEDLVKEVGDTQYTFPGETQTMDRVEVKTPRTGKKPVIQPRKTPARKTGSDSRNQSEEASADGEAAGPTIVRTQDRYEGDAPKIVFSNSGLDGKKDIDKFLRTNGGKKMDNASAPGVNFLVVGPGELKRTPKLTVGVALGKNVVEDQWLIDSKETGYFLDPDQYIPNDPLHEKEWGFNLQAAIERGREGKNSVLKDWSVNITPALISQLKASGQEESLIEMLKASGAGNIVKKAPRSKMGDDEKVLVLGNEKADGEISVLGKAGWKVFSTGIVALSVLRGRLDTESNEFRIKADDTASLGADAQPQKPRRKAR